MEEERISIKRPVHIRPRVVYGLRTDVIGNIQLNQKWEVIYPVESLLAIHDFENKKQRFMRFPDNSLPEVIAISHNRTKLAIYERNEITGRCIMIYDLRSLKLCRSIELPDDYKNAEIVQLTFTYDLRGIVVLTKPPKEMLFIIMFDKLFTTHKWKNTSRPNADIRAECFACYQPDSNYFAIGGKNMLHLMTITEDGFNISQNVKCDFHVTTCSFGFQDMLLLGTNDNQLMLVECGDIKLRLIASEVLRLELNMDQEQFDRIRISYHGRTPARIILDLLDFRVIHLKHFSRGFTFAIFNTVFVFEQISKSRYDRKTVLIIPKTVHTTESYQITNLAINEKEQTIIVTTKHAQIYTGPLFVQGNYVGSAKVNFEPLGTQLHTSEIVDMSICLWKSVVITASRDRTIRIINYETGVVDLLYKFKDDLHLVELSATGLMAAIAFTDQLRLMTVLMDEFYPVKSYNFVRCRAMRFSNLGHLLAAGYDTNVTIISAYRFQRLHHLKGHSGTVIAICWSHNDKYLFSSDVEGAIYQWRVTTGERLYDIVQKGTEYLSLAVTRTAPYTIYATTQTGTLRVFQNSKKVREIQMPTRTTDRVRLPNVSLSRSNLILFISNNQGDLFNLQLPFLDMGGGTITNFRFFIQQINKMFITKDDKKLIAVGKSGTMIIFDMFHTAGRRARLDPQLLKCTAVVVPLPHLVAKLDQIEHLKLRSKQQMEEYKYQMSQNEIFDEQQLADVHRSYCSALEVLKEVNNKIIESHATAMNKVTKQMAEVREAHVKNIELLYMKYEEAMVIEFEKFTKLRNDMLKLQHAYETKLRNSTGKLQVLIEAYEHDYNTEISERNDILRSLLAEMHDRSTEFIAYCRTCYFEFDGHRAKQLRKDDYRIRNKRNETSMFRGKTIVLKKLCISTSKRIDELLEEQELLKDNQRKAKRKVERLHGAVNDLQKDITDHDITILIKDETIHRLQINNQNVEKSKLVLLHRITKLKKLIEPTEFSLAEVRRELVNMELNMDKLSKGHIALQHHLNEQTTNYMNSIDELASEREHARAARERIDQLRNDIYNCAGKTSSEKCLREAVQELLEKYVTEDEINFNIRPEENVRAEIGRHRAHCLAEVEVYRKVHKDEELQQLYDEKFEANYKLTDEIEILRFENRRLKSFVREKLAQKKKKKITG